MDEPKHRGPQDGIGGGGGEAIVFEERTSKTMIRSDLRASGDCSLEVELLQPA